MSKKQAKPQILKGFRDYLPEQMVLRQAVIQRFRATFERYGFAPLDTPAIEYLEILTGKAGENEKLMYSFHDQGDREVGLRYDLTVPLARVVAMHQSEIVLPFRRYHIAPVWRAEKPQRGRFREFWQCDVDIAGTTLMLADAEVITVMGEALDVVGLPEYRVLISHRKLLERIAVQAGVDDSVAPAVYRAVDKIDKIGSDGVIAELRKSGVGESVAQRLLEAVAPGQETDAHIASLRRSLESDDEGLTALFEIEEIFRFAPEMGMDPNRLVFDPSLARGLDYYTGPVFEAVVDQPRVGSVAGGGRYGELVGSFANRPIPATGISLGLERILEVITEFNTITIDGLGTDVVVVVFRDDLVRSAATAAKLRQTGLRVELSMQTNKSVGEQLKQADRKGIPFAVIPGEAEAESGRVGLKNLHSGAQQDMAVDQVANAIQSGR